MGAVAKSLSSNESIQLWNRCGLTLLTGEAQPLALGSKADVEHAWGDPTAQELSASGMRLITMSLGIMQSFNGIQRIDLEWPVTRPKRHEMA